MKSGLVINYIAEFISWMCKEVTSGTRRTFGYLLRKMHATNDSEWPRSSNHCDMLLRKKKTLVDFYDIISSM